MYKIPVKLPDSLMHYCLCCNKFVLIKAFYQSPAREEAASSPDLTYQHVAKLWQNWLPPKAMATLEKGKERYFSA